MSAAWYSLHAVNHLFTVGDDNKGDGRGWTDTGWIALGALALAYMARAAGRVEQGGGLRTPSAPARPRDYPPGD